MAQEDKVWWYAKGEQKSGPYTALQLKEIAARGTLELTDLVWKNGLPNWLPASSFKGLIPEKASATPPPIPQVQERNNATAPIKSESSVKKSQPMRTNSNAVAIWNPGAAASWSLLFTPVFGAYIHALNWRALKEEQRYARAMIWFYAGIVVLISSAFVSNGGAALIFWYLIIWYFAAGKNQAKYIKESFGVDYPRQTWGKPLGIAGIAFVAYCLVAAALR